MKKMPYIFSALLAALCILTTPAATRAGDLAFTAGGFNTFNGGASFQYGLEYRTAPSEYTLLEYDLRPILGAYGTSDGSASVYAGLNWDIELLENELYVIPNFAVGAYHEGSGKDLGGAIEFRSGIEIAYQMENLHRIGVAINHTSNAGLYDDNPGTESILLVYTLPFDKLF